MQEGSSSNQSARPVDVSLHGVLDHVCLPQIQRQHFDDGIDDWLSFRDLYTSLVHEKTDLSDVEKLHYLKGCLSGETETKAQIDPLKIKRENYQIAWNTLLRRYNNNKMVQKKEMQALIKLPMAKESSTDLHKLVDGIDRMVQSRLDPTTRREREKHSSTKNQEALKDLHAFLHRRISILEALPTKAEVEVDQSAQLKRNTIQVGGIGAI